MSAPDNDRYYIVVGKGDEPHNLARVKDPAKFAQDGERILAIKLSDGSQHLVKFGESAVDGTNWVVKDGILHLHAEKWAPLRSYRDWAYYEERPFKTPPEAGRLRVAKPSPR